VPDFIANAVGSTVAAGIRTWVRVTGRRVAKRDAPWLQCPMGPPGVIGDGFYRQLAETANLEIRPTPDAGIHPDFASLAGHGFDPDRVDPAIREFYEHTTRYRFEAWSEAPVHTRFFLWFLTRYVSRQMNQLNFPVSSLELAGGMSSEVLPMYDRDTGRLVFTGWLRRTVNPPRVIYTGLYMTEQPPEAPAPCVKVCFPVPYGSAVVFLRPQVKADGSFLLMGSGSKFGDSGFYRLVEVDDDHWRVRYIRTLHERFYVYLDPQGTLRTDHVVKLMGLTVLRLHYKLAPA